MARLLQGFTFGTLTKFNLYITRRVSFGISFEKNKVKTNEMGSNVATILGKELFEIVWLLFVIVFLLKIQYSDNKAIIIAFILYLKENVSSEANKKTQIVHLA